MSANSALIVQAAMRTALINDPALLAILNTPRVYDVPPDEPQFPYLTFGEIETRDWSTQTQTGHEHFVTLHIWSRQPSRKQTQEILAATDAALDGAVLTLTDLHLVNMRVVFWTVLRELDGETYHGVMRLRVVTEANSTT